MRVFMGGKVERIQNKSKKEADCPKRKQSKAADNKEKAFCSFRHEDLRLQPIQHPRERYRHVFACRTPRGGSLLFPCRSRCAGPSRSVEDRDTIRTIRAEAYAPQV